jgi:hypothetical protein
LIGNIRSQPAAPASQRYSHQAVEPRLLGVPINQAIYFISLCSLPGRMS